MTPLQIQILMHYNNWDFDFYEMYVSTGKDDINHLVTKGYLVKSAGPKDLYEPTAKLHAYCEALCNMPEPVQKWVVEL